MSYTEQNPIRNHNIIRLIYFYKNIIVFFTGDFLRNANLSLSLPPFHDKSSKSRGFSSPNHIPYCTRVATKIRIWAISACGGIHSKTTSQPHHLRYIYTGSGLWRFKNQRTDFSHAPPRRNSCGPTGTRISPRNFFLAVFFFFTK